MPFLLVRQDITKMHVDAIVNAANPTLLGAGGVDGAIHRAAGPRLLAECRTLGGCDVGDAKRTLGYDLPCTYVIHTVGPIWQGGCRGEAEQLRSCYNRSLLLAQQAGCESVAFPLISAGVYGYPKQQALHIASETIRAFLQSSDMTVYLVLFDADALHAAQERFGTIRSFIEDAYVEQQKKKEPLDARRRQLGTLRSAPVCKSTPEDKKLSEECSMFRTDQTASLEQMLGEMDESFAQMLFRLIDKSGMTDAQCYKKANIDRKLFSKIRSNPLYKPSKNTALAFAIALELPFDQTQELLRKAGYTLSHSSKFDIILEYYIRAHIYDLFTINETLFAFDQSLLGA